MTDLYVSQEVILVTETLDSDIRITQEAVLVAFSPDTRVAITQQPVLVLYGGYVLKYAITSFLQYILVRSKETLLSLNKAADILIESKKVLTTVSKQTELVVYYAIRPHELSWLKEVIIRSKSVLVTLKKQTDLLLEPKHTSISLTKQQELSVTNPQHPPELIYPYFPAQPSRVTQVAVLCLYN